MIGLGIGPVLAAQILKSFSYTLTLTVMSVVIGTISLIIIGLIHDKLNVKD